MALAAGGQGPTPPWIVDGLVLGVLLQCDRRAIRTYLAAGR
jgi:hypothetical protein